MDEKRLTRLRYKACFAFVVGYCLVAVSACGKVERPCIPITRWGDFYVGMSYGDAKKYLPEAHKLVDRSPGFKYREPQRGEDIYLVRVETDDGWYALGFDNSKTLVRIGVVED